MIVPVVVEGQSLRWYGRIPEIADNSIEFVQLEFRFPEDWDNMVIVAQFTQIKTYNCLLVNNRCFLPMELVAGPCEISVFGYLNEEVTRGTTIPLKLNISRSGFVSSAETPIPPTPDLYAQLIEYFSNIASSGGGGSGSGTINPEDIAAAVEDYLSKNPPEVPDLSDEVDRAETAATSAASSAAVADKAASDAEAAAARAEEAAKVTTDLDTTLTQAGKAADAKAVGDAISKLSGGNANQGTGWTTEQINLLDELFNHVHFNSAEGGTIADDLIASLRGEAVKTLVSISATYSGGEVEEGTALTALSGIVVTATYDDGSTATVYGYTLSGTIAEGENTITVSYGGKTATFTVTGTANSGGGEEPDTTTYTITNNLTNVTTSNATSTVEQGGSYSATLLAADGYTLDGANVTVTIGGVDFTSSVYLNGEINIATVSGDIVITATAVADITSVVVEMVKNTLTRDELTIYSDEGITVDEGTYSGSIGTAVVSSMAFSADTEVRVTRKRASEGSTWTTVLIGESDPNDLTKIYNAVVHDYKFVDETIERPHDYTVHAGRKLVVRYYHHLASSVLVTSSVAPDVPDVPDTPVGSEVAMTYAGSNLHADAGNANAISNFTVYTDEGTTAITYPVENVDEYLNGRYISDEAFEPDTDVTITRSVATAACWTTIVIGECDTDDESVVYNAVLSDHGFATPSTEKTYSYTVRAGRKLVMFRRNNNFNAYTLTVTK